MQKRASVLCLFFCSISFLTCAQQYDTTYYQDQFRHIRSILVDSLDDDSALLLLENLPAIQDTIAKSYRLIQAQKSKLICECYFSQGAYDQAIQYCTKSLNNHRRILGQTTEEVGKLYNLLSQIYGTKGLGDEAVEKDEIAYSIFVELFGEQHPRTSIYKASLASHYILDSQADELAQKGYEYLTEVLQIQLEAFGENSLYTAETLHFLGRFYHRKGQYYKALDFHKRALHINLMLGKHNSTLVYYLYRVIGTLYNLINDNEMAEDYLKLALEGNIATLGEDHVMLSIDYYSLAGICKTSDRFEEAAMYLNKGIGVISKKYGTEHISLAHMYELVGQIYIEGGEYQKGVDINEKALNIWTSFSEEPILNFTYSLNNIATGNRLLGKTHTAIDFFQRALQVYEQTNSLKFPEVAETYLGLAKAYADLGELDKACDNFDLALETLNFEEGKNQFEQVTSLPILVKVLVTYGTLLKDWPKTGESYALQDQAIQKYSYALQVLDLMQIEVQSPESQQFMRQIAVETLFEPLITLKHKRNQGTDLEESFQIAERGKALTLLISFNRSNAYQFDTELQLLVEKEEQIRAMIKEIEQNITMEKSKGGQADTGTVEELDEQQNEYRRQLYSNLETLERDYPDYYQLKHQVEVYTVPQVRKLLPNPETALLEYFVGNKSIYAFIITKDDYQVVQMPFYPDLPKRIAELREQMTYFSSSSNRSDSNSRLQADRLTELLFELYEGIFAPIKEQANLPEQLIIVPDGILGYLPFEMLVSQRPKDPTLFANHAFLIKDHQISYSYSATLLGQIRSKKKTSTKGPFLAFAPNFKDQKEQGEYRNLLSTRSELAPLKYNIPEAQSLQHLMGGAAFIGDQATEEAFVQHASDYRVIHLATHAKADDQVGDYAYLAFAEIPDSIENELLYNRELYQLGLEADMVVLSACETGTGELQRGEGIISLARGFSYAGAKSIITTLWNVDDQKTKDLMESFYGYIKSGQPKDAALRQAKLDFIDQYSHDAHPFYWAAFIPIGDMRPIDFDTGQTILPGGILVAMVLIMIFLYLRQSRYR